MEDYRNNKPVEPLPLIPKTFEGLVNWLKINLACPLPVNEGALYFPLRNKLIGLWREMVREQSVDDEWHHIY